MEAPTKTSGFFVFIKINYTFAYMTQAVITILFISLVLQESIDISTWIKIIFKIKISKRLKLIDCFPCMTFWIAVIYSLVTNQNYIVPLTSFVVAKFYETWKINN